MSSRYNGSKGTVPSSPYGILWFECVVNDEIRMQTINSLTCAKRSPGRLGYAAGTYSGAGPVTQKSKNYTEFMDPDHELGAHLEDSDMKPGFAGKRVHS